jgi:hypothetical protein
MYSKEREKLVPSMSQERKLVERVEIKRGIFVNGLYRTHIFILVASPTRRMKCATRT